MVPTHETDPVQLVDDKHESTVDEVEQAKDLSKSFGDHAVGNAFLVGADGRVRRIPVPSSDPNDPLNFLPWQKYGVIICCCWFCKFREILFYLDALLTLFISHHVTIAVWWPWCHPKHLL